MVGSIQKWRVERGGAMFINLVLESLMVTSAGDVRRRKRATSVCVERWGGGRGVGIGVHYEHYLWHPK